MAGLYTVVWGKSKDLKEGKDDNEGRELPVKDDTRSVSDNFDDKIEVSVGAHKLKPSSAATTT